MIMLTLKAWLTQFKIEMKLFSREPIYIFFVMLLPAISFIVIGSMFKNNSYGNMTFFQKYIPGFIAIIMYSSTIFSVGLQMVIDKESGVFKRLKATPVRMRNVFAIVATKGILISVVGLTEIVLVAKLVFRADLAVHWGQFIVGFAVSIAALMALGFMVASLFNNIKSAIAALMVTFYPVFFLSDATIPLKAMPKVLRQVAPAINPLYHVNVFLTSSWSGKMMSRTASTSFLYLLVLSAIALIVSAALYRKEAA